MGITIRKKRLKNNEESIYFDICHDDRRWYKFSKIRLLPGSSPGSVQNAGNVFLSHIKLKPLFPDFIDYKQLNISLFGFFIHNLFARERIRF